MPLSWEVGKSPSLLWLPLELSALKEDWKTGDEDGSASSPSSLFFSSFCEGLSGLDAFSGAATFFAKGFLVSLFSSGESTVLRESLRDFGVLNDASLIIADMLVAPPQFSFASGKIVKSSLSFSVKLSVLYINFPTVVCSASNCENQEPDKDADLAFFALLCDGEFFKGLGLDEVSAAFSVAFTIEVFLEL